MEYRICPTVYTMHVAVLPISVQLALTDSHPASRILSRVAASACDRRSVILMIICPCGNGLKSYSAPRTGTTSEGGGELTSGTRRPQKCANGRHASTRCESFGTIQSQSCHRHNAPLVMLPMLPKHDSTLPGTMQNSMEWNVRQMCARMVSGMLALHEQDTHDDCISAVTILPQGFA